MSFKNERPASPLNVFNTEILALIEYVRQNRLAKRVNLDAVKNAWRKYLHAIWHAKEQDLSSKGLDQATLDAKLNVIELARKKEADSDSPAWYQLSSDLVKMLNNPSNDALYTRMGSIERYFSNDKQGAVTVEKDVTLVNTLPSGKVYFMPKIAVQTAARKMYQLNMFDAISPSQMDKAATALINTRNPHLCNYDMSPVQDDESTVIYGNKPALEELVRVQPTPGILPACGIHGCQLSMVTPGYSANGYKIVLNPENTKLFRKQMEDSNSLLREKGIVLTRTSTVGKMNDSSTKPMDDRDDEVSQEHKGEGEQSEAFEKMKEQIVDTTPQKQEALSKLLESALKVIATYKSHAASIGKRIPNPDFSLDGLKDLDKDDLVFAEMNLIADFTLEFAKAYGVELPTKRMYAGVKSVQFVIMNSNEGSILNAKVERDPNGATSAQVHKLLTSIVNVLNRFWYYAETKMTDVYATLSSDKDKGASEAAKQQKRDAVMSKTYTLSNGKKMTLSAIMSLMSKYVTQDKELNVMDVPPFVLRPFESLCRRDASTWGEDDMQGIATIVKYVDGRLTKEQPAAPQPAPEETAGAEPEAESPDSDIDEDDDEFMLGAATRMF